MKTVINESGGQVVVAVTGELDTNTSAAFQKDVAPLMERTELAVTLDMGKLDYISSKALRILISFRQAILSHGGSLTVSAVSPTVREVFDMTGLTSSFLD